MPGSEQSSRNRRRRWLAECGYACAYLFIAVYASWPLCWTPASTISMGFENEAAVPLLNVWTLWWNSDRCAAGFHDYWNAPIFYPTQGAFAFSEAQPPMALMSPIVWLTGSRILAYNLYLLLILTLNGYSSLCLFRRVGHQTGLAFLGGVMCQMLPFIWWQSGVVQLTTLFGMVWTIQMLVDVFNLQFRSADGSLLHAVDESMLGYILSGVKLSAAFCLTYTMCNYWGMFLTLLLIPSSIWLWNLSTLRLRFWIALSLGALLTLLVLLPLVTTQRSLAAQHKWSREQNWIRDLSAHPRDYLDTPSTPKAHDRSIEPDAAEVESDPAKIERVDWSKIPQFDAAEESRNNTWPLGGGIAKLLIAPIGLLASLFVRGRRRWGLFAATFGLLAFGLSLGPTVWFCPWVPGVANLSPYELLQQYVPGFKLIRSPFRFSLFVQWAVVWLNIEALDLLNPWRWWQRPFRKPPVIPLEAPDAVVDPTVPYVHPALRNPPPSIIPVVLQSLSLSLMIVGSYALIVEVWPPRQAQFHCQVTGTPAWIMWLRENSLPDDAVICLPFPYGYNVGDYESTSVWMYWGTFHRRRMVNGYSGFFPQHFIDLKEKLQRDGAELKYYPWDSVALTDISDCGARFVVVKRSFATRDDVWQHPRTKFRWAWVTADEEHQLDIYEVQPPFQD